MDEKNWITIREYAEQQGITYEAARQAVRRHRKPLIAEGHIIVERNKTWLDEEAVEFLQDKHHKPKLVFRNSRDIWNAMSDAEKLENTQIRLDYARRDVETWTNMYMDIRKENAQIREELENTRESLEIYMKKYQDMKARYSGLQGVLGKVKNMIIDKIYDMDVLNEILALIGDEMTK